METFALRPLWGFLSSAQSRFDRDLSLPDRWYFSARHRRDPEFLRRLRTVRQPCASRLKNWKVAILSQNNFQPHLMRSFP